MARDLPAGYDNWLTGGDLSYGTIDMYCPNKYCKAHLERVTVGVERSYGNTWLEQEECEVCGHELLEE